MPRLEMSRSEIDRFLYNLPSNVKILNIGLDQKSESDQQQKLISFLQRVDAARETIMSKLKIDVCGIVHSMNKTLRESGMDMLFTFHNYQCCTVPCLMTLHPNIGDAYRQALVQYKICSDDTIQLAPIIKCKKCKKSKTCKKKSFDLNLVID